MALVTSTDLGLYLQRPVQADSATMAIRVAESWLHGVIPDSSWPEGTPPEDLWGWALELASIAYANPESLTVRTVGAITNQWGGTSGASRRQQILDAAAARYGGGRAPQYSFPLPLPWPDPPRVAGVTCPPWRTG